MLTFIVFPHFDLVKFDHVPFKKKKSHSILLKSLFLLFEVGAYRNLMFVSGFILSGCFRFVSTGSHRRLCKCKFDFQQETKSDFVKF